MDFQKVHKENFHIIKKHALADFLYNFVAKN